MTKLINGDCIEEMKKLEDNSIDLLFCDLPYGQTSCKWDSLINLDKFWKEINRVCKINCPMFFCCTTKFGASLINSNPKNYRNDFVWAKSRKSGFLNSGKMPLRSHEMVYMFYRKQPVYNVKQYHKHKFLKEPDDKKIKTTLYSSNGKERKLERVANDIVYDPPLPNSVITETRDDDGCVSMYGNEKGKKDRYIVDGKLRDSEPRYDPPLPESVITESIYESTSLYGTENKKIRFKNEDGSINKELNAERYTPPLPHSVIKQDVKEEIYNIVLRNNFGCDTNLYEPPLPDSVLSIKNQGRLHQTQKPTDLISFFIKYYSNEGDTILDPTMGSGSTGISCKELNRKFIGIELDEKIFKTAEERINKNK